MPTPIDDAGIQRDGYVFLDPRTGISVEIEDYYTLLAKCGPRYQRLELDLGSIEGEAVTLVFIPVALKWQPDAAPATKNEQESLRRVIGFMYKDALVKPHFIDTP